MEKINFYDINFPFRFDYSSGSYGRVWQCKYKDKDYAFKFFDLPSYLEGKKQKLNEISKIKDPHLYVPLYWLYNSMGENDYLTNFCFGKDLDLFMEDNIEYKIKILKSGKDAIIKMHDNGIIHSDLIGSNIMIENDEARIIDFDNCTFDKFKTNPEQSNDLSKDFIEHFGIIPEVDTYLYNLLTFSIINECGLYQVRGKIQKEEYQYFDDNKDAIEICKKMRLDNTLPQKDFLIDTAR